MDTGESQSIQIEGFTIHYNKFIGKGQFGLVWEATHPQINVPLCAKQMVISQEIDNSKQLQREIEIMMNISEAQNKNLIQLYKAFKSNTVFYLIMERVIGEDLENRMRNYQMNKQRFPLQNIFNIVKQIANGFKTLNQKQIIHRDLKPANILISQDETIKICDFGMGRVVDQVNKKLFLTKVGTPAYVAPQLYFETQFSSKCDVYSLGIIVYQLIYNSFPFTASTESELIEFLKQQKIAPIQCPQIEQPGTQDQKGFFINFLQKTITYLEEDRYSWDQVFQMIDQFAPQFEQQQQQNCPPQLAKPKIKIVIKSVEEQQNGDMKLYDSILILKQNYQPIKFNNTKFNYSSQYSDTSKAGRVNHILKIMIAKYDLGDKFLSKFIQNVENLKREEAFKEFHYNLILTCIVGYLAKLMYNAKAFSTNCYDYLSQTIKDKYKKVDLEMAIQEYATVISQEKQEIKQEVSQRLQSISYSFTYQENYMLQMLSKRFQFQIKTVAEFKKFLQQHDNTDYEYFAQFFNKFYELYLQKLLKVDQNTAQDQLIFVAYCEAFNNLEKDYPFDKYSEQNPKHIILNENIPNILLNYINAKRPKEKK